MHILKDAMPTDIITPFTEGKTIQVLVIAIITALIISLNENRRQTGNSKSF